MAVPLASYRFALECAHVKTVCYTLRLIFSIWEKIATPKSS